MTRVIGIDLGTTNSRVSIMDRGKPRILGNSEGIKSIPSVVSISEKSEMLVGLPDDSHSISHKDSSFVSSKRILGRQYDDPAVAKLINEFQYPLVESDTGDVNIRLGSAMYSPVQVTALTIQNLKRTAESFLGEEINEAVISVPALFNNVQRNATIAAAKIAGLECLRVLNESVAAVLEYGLEVHDTKTIVVFDLGGGTLSISILEIGDGIFEVKSTKGDTFLGGEDFDMRLIDFLVQEIMRKTDIDFSKDKLLIQKMKQLAEMSKIDLSSLPQIEINIPLNESIDSVPKHLNIKLSREKFEQLFKDLIDKIIKLCNSVLIDAGLNSTKIDEVLLVGGMSRMPIIKEIVKEKFGKEPVKDKNPDEAIANGMAIQAGILQGDVKDILILDVTPFSIGIETHNGVFTRMIERNTTIPTKKSQIFTTTEDNQSAVTVRIFQGEREMATDNYFLGQVDLLGISPELKGTAQIEVTFDIDVQERVVVFVKDKSTGNESIRNLDSIDQLRANSSILGELTANFDFVFQNDVSFLGGLRNLVLNMLSRK